MESPHFLIATPAHGANVKLEFLNSLMQTQRMLDRKGIRHAFLGAAHAEIVAARNFLASFMYEREEFTHLLFVDSDMAFTPATVEKLIAAGKPLVGCICPRREIDLATVVRLGSKGADARLAMAGALDFVVRYPPGATSVQISDGFATVRGIGMALTLIHRSVFAGLIAAGSVARYDRHVFGKQGLRGPMQGFFDLLQDPAVGNLSEDFSFCERVIRGGGECWALASEAIHHIGDFDYGGSYVDHLAARQL